MRILTRAIWLLTFCMLLLFTVVGSVGAWRAHDSKKWPTADGIVVAFYEAPNYRYVIGGKSYTGSVVSCNEFFNGYLSIWNSAKSAVRYPLQAKVAVHYCPNNPTLAVLETAFDSRIITAIVLLVMMTSLSFAGLVFGWRFRWCHLVVR